MHNFKSKNFSQDGFFDSTWNKAKTFEEESVQKLPYNNQHATAQGDISKNFRFAVTDANFFSSCKCKAHFKTFMLTIIISLFISVEEESTIKVSPLNRDSHRNVANLDNLALKNLSIMI